MAEMTFESSLVATVCFVKEDDPAINLPRILVGASAMLQVKPLAKKKVVLWSILLPSNITEDTFIQSECEIQVLRVCREVG